MNPTAMRNCPDCGTPIVQPDGLCPQCLFSRAKADTVHFSEESPTALDSSTDGPVSKPLAPPLGDIKYFGDYELLEEVARGGMGVVYKARQRSLNRIVAVKMILAGNLAGEAEVERFHVEAEAAANLQHPNIVSIHEVGEHDGQHYYSMDFVQGRHLGKVIAGKPMPSAEAVRLLKTVAETVHYAHQRGILHRDLKPQNILIVSETTVAAERKETRERFPLVTDFGLAKRLEQNTGLTATGAVMGSPAYMPSEQAQGRQDLMGPASDVYSLGAILYEMLTGRPPFEGETPLAILSQVVHEPPLPPRKSNPNLNVDLETICLKCLEKEPGRRYSSARELAEELGRFLNDQPILARPASKSRRFSSWLVRNPSAVSAILAALFMLVLGVAFGLWQGIRKQKWHALMLEAAAKIRMPSDEGHTNSPSPQQQAAQCLVQAGKIHPDQEVSNAILDAISVGATRVRLSRQGATNISKLRPSQDGTSVAVEYLDTVVEMLSLTNGKSLVMPPATGKRPRLLAISSNGRFLATAEPDISPNQVQLWDVETGTIRSSLGPHIGRVSCFAFSPDNTLVAVGSASDRTPTPAHLFHEGKPPLLIDGEERDQFFYTNQQNKIEMKLWSLRDSSLIRTLSLPRTDEAIVRLLASHRGQVSVNYHNKLEDLSFLAFGSDGQSLITAKFFDGSPFPNQIQSWDAGSNGVGEFVVPRLIHAADPTGFELAALSFDRKSAVLARPDPLGTGVLLNLVVFDKSLSLKCSLIGQTIPIVFSPDNTLVATFSTNAGQSRLWSLPDGHELGPMPGKVEGFDFAGRAIGVDAKSSSLVLWNPETINRQIPSSFWELSRQPAKLDMTPLASFWLLGCFWIWNRVYLKSRKRYENYGERIPNGVFQFTLIFGLSGVILAVLIVANLITGIVWNGEFAHSLRRPSDSILPLCMLGMGLVIVVCLVQDTLAQRKGLVLTSAATPLQVMLYAILFCLIAPLMLWRMIDGYVWLFQFFKAFAWLLLAHFFVTGLMGFLVGSRHFRYGAASVVPGATCVALMVSLMVGAHPPPAIDIWFDVALFLVTPAGASAGFAFGRVASTRSKNGSRERTRLGY